MNFSNNNNMKIELPYYQPYITSYLHHALFLSLLPPTDDCFAWVYSNYINVFAIKNFYLIYDKGKEGIEIDYLPYETHNSPLLNINKHKREDYNNDNLIRFIIDCLSESKYIRYASINDDSKYFVMIIYGIEQNSNNIMYLSYNNKWEFVTNKMSYADLFGFHSKNRKNKFLSDISDLDLINMWSISFNNKKIEFELEKIVFNLKDYINSQNNYYYIPTQNCVFGIDIYHEMQNYFDYIAENTFFDIRPFKFIAEHKKIMIQRLNYLQKTYKNVVPFMADYDQLLKMALFLNNLMMKYRLASNSATLSKARDTIRLIKENESKILDKMLSMLIH